MALFEHTGKDEDGTRASIVTDLQRLAIFMMRGLTSEHEEMGKEWGRTRASLISPYMSI